jgi:GDP-4-dehydro-6-deoxy-D-mannose reductase
MRVLITGIGGFAASHLAEFLLKKKVCVYGLLREKKIPERLRPVRRSLRLFCCDMLDARAVSKTVARIKPDRIFHLAAQSFVPASWTAPAETLRTNVHGTLNLLEAIRRGECRTKVHVAGSSEAYGVVNRAEIPIRENCVLNPVNPYGVSKAAQDLLASQYFRSFGIEGVVTRAFLHLGPGQREDFVASALAKQVALIEASRCPRVIKVGNLGAVRDFTDVRDVARAYWLALEKGENGGIYNICSGRGRSVREILDFYLAKCRVKIRVERDPERFRPLEAEVLVGDPSRFMKKTGWKPRILFEQTLMDLLNDWRRKVGS